MSAAKKLKALDEAMTPWGSTWESELGGLYANEGLGAYIRDVNVDYEGGLPRDLVLSVIALRNALPQIVAVVEAAEQYAILEDGTPFLGLPVLATALAALDEALP